jgi:hypothetical protein
MGGEDSSGRYRICAEGVADECQSGDCRHAEGHENSSKLPIEDAS